MTGDVWDELESTKDATPRDRWGRPLILPANAKLGTKPVAYTRVTTYAKAIEDTFNLSLWSQRMVALGLAARPDLVLAASAHADDRDELNRIVEAAKEAAQAGAAARTGTALHRLAERYDRGELTLEQMPESHRADIAAYVAAMAPLGLCGIEQFVVIDQLKVGGTFDRIVEHDGRRYVADIKTGSIEYGVASMAIQLALYAHGEIYAPGDGERLATGVQTNAGLIIHLPAGQGTCQLYWINLRAGWEAARLCAEVREWRSRKDLLVAASFGPAVLAVPDERQAVAILAETLGAVEVPLSEQVKGADSAEALEQLWSEHRDDWTAEHTRLAAARKLQLHQRVLHRLVGA